MKNSTWIWIAGLGAAYFFLANRTPVFAKQTDGTYQPVGILDRMTVALTGAIPPAPSTTNVSIPGIVDFSYTN